MRVVTLKRLLAVALVAFAFTAAADAPAPTYRAVDVASVIGSSSVPVAVNDEGIVAAAGWENGLPSSVLYSVQSGTIVYRFALGDRVESLSPGGSAAGNTVMGEGWLLRDGVRTAIPLQHALGVNDRGQVAGWVGGFFPQAVVFDATTGVLTHLGTLGGTQSVAMAIDQNGRIAGHSTTAAAQDHAFRWSRDVMQDLGTLSGTGFSMGLAIDEAGRVAGITTVSPAAAHAFLYDDDGMHDLGTLPGCARTRATAMNNHGTVVGVADSCATGGERAFVFSNGVMYDLNDLVLPPDGFVYEQPTGVNDDGTIVGIGRPAGGFSTQPFLVVRGDDG